MTVCLLAKIINGSPSSSYLGLLLFLSLFSKKGTTSFFGIWENVAGTSEEEREREVGVPRLPFSLRDL